VRRALVHAAVAAIVSALAACSHRTAPQPFASWELRGTVVDQSGEHLRIRHKSGRIVELVLDDRTAVIDQEGAAALSALRHGRRVIVKVEPLADGAARAAQVRVFGAG